MANNKKEELIKMLEDIETDNRSFGISIGLLNQNGEVDANIDVDYTDDLHLDGTTLFYNRRQIDLDDEVTYFMMHFTEFGELRQMVIQLRNVISYEITNVNLIA